MLGLQTRPRNFGRVPTISNAVKQTRFLAGTRNREAFGNLPAGPRRVNYTVRRLAVRTKGGHSFGGDDISEQGPEYTKYGYRKGYRMGPPLSPAERLGILTRTERDKANLMQGPYADPAQRNTFQLEREAALANSSLQAGLNNISASVDNTHQQLAQMAQDMNQAIQALPPLATQHANQIVSGVANILQSSASGGPLGPPRIPGHMPGVPVNSGPTANQIAAGNSAGGPLKPTALHSSWTGMLNNWWSSYTGSTGQSSSSIPPSNSAPNTNMGGGGAPPSQPNDKGKSPDTSKITANRHVQDYLNDTGQNKKDIQAKAQEKPVATLHKVNKVMISHHIPADRLNNQRVVSPAYVVALHENGKLSDYQFSVLFPYVSAIAERQILDSYYPNSPTEGDVFLQEIANYNIKLPKIRTAK